MSNVLSEEKKQQVIALGKLGWSLRRIEEATGVRRETASAYLRTAGVVVYLPGWGRRAPAKPAIQATPDFFAAFSRKPPAPSTCEAYRERIEEGPRSQRQGHLAGLGVGARVYRWLSGGEALCAKAARTTTAGTSGHHPHCSGRRSAGRLRQWSDGARSAERQVSPDAAVRPYARLQSQVGSLAGLAIECTNVGRAARESLSPPRWLSESHRSRQLERRSGGSGYLRSRHQPTVSRCSRALRRSGLALPNSGSRWQREGGVRHRPHQENSTQGDALREPGRSAGVSRSLGTDLG